MSSTRSTLTDGVAAEYCYPLGVAIALFGMECDPGIAEVDDNLSGPLLKSAKVRRETLAGIEQGRHCKAQSSPSQVWTVTSRIVYVRPKGDDDPRGAGSYWPSAAEKDLRAA